MIVNLTGEIHLTSPLSYPPDTTILGPATLVIDNPMYSAINITANELSPKKGGIYGIHVQNGHNLVHGIRLMHTARWEIENCTIQNVQHAALMLEGCVGVIARRNEFLSSLFGVRMGTSSTGEPCRFISIKDHNILQANTWGVYADQAALVKVEGNEIDFNQGGVWIENACLTAEGVGAIIRDNWFERQTVHADIRICQALFPNTLHIVENNLGPSGTRAAGIHLHGAPHVRLTTNNFQNTQPLVED